MNINDYYFYFEEFKPSFSKTKLIVAEEDEHQGHSTTMIGLSEDVKFPKTDFKKLSIKNFDKIQTQEKLSEIIKIGCEMFSENPGENIEFLTFKSKNAARRILKHWRKYKMKLFSEKAVQIKPIKKLQIENTETKEVEKRELKFEKIEKTTQTELDAHTIQNILDFKSNFNQKLPDKNELSAVLKFLLYIQNTQQ